MVAAEKTLHYKKQFHFALLRVHSPVLGNKQKKPIYRDIIKPEDTIAKLQPGHENHKSLVMRWENDAQCLAGCFGAPRDRASAIYLIYF